jgi:hypothetical protein
MVIAPPVSNEIIPAWTAAVQTDDWSVYVPVPHTAAALPPGGHWNVYLRPARHPGSCGFASHATVVGTHRAFEQTVPAAHATPQPPQLRLSLRASTHCPPQSVSVAAQTSRHAPIAHTCPTLHARPHAPQWNVSRCGLTQRASQRVSPAAQRSRHAPAAHSSPSPHWAPHAPQWLASVLVLTQRPLQTVLPAAHVAVHAPITHA